MEVEIIDNNKIKEFASGAKRENKDNKSRPDLISPYFQERLGFVLAKGAIEHEERNWEKGIPNESFLSSMERHLIAYKMSINKGISCNIPENDDHLGQMAFNLMGLIHNEEVEKIYKNRGRG